MSPEERLYRDLFMQELWPTCREFGHEPRPPERQYPAPRKRCHLCGEVYTRAYLGRHIRTIHMGGGISPGLSTGCAENGVTESDRGASECA